MFHYALTYLPLASLLFNSVVIAGDSPSQVEGDLIDMTQAAVSLLGLANQITAVDCALAAVGMGKVPVSRPWDDPVIMPFVLAFFRSYYVRTIDKQMGQLAAALNTNANTVAESTAITSAGTDATTVGDDYLNFALVIMDFYNTLVAKACNLKSCGLTAAAALLTNFANDLGDFETAFEAYNQVLSDYDKPVAYYIGVIRRIVAKMKNNAAAALSSSL
ncbi:hypothetical protein QBC46DRAFT_413160 [Diplogelasinospora grovesii]|uniref:Uncharacterized protein n=1 Tax=Diplogelasinospora grovesii TaxID=303347 RepID=A0AAN6S099_9PEZI|nr:hypothetical protein QBC46DRAFT_413160 [Diplogelasinospora grovesii]